MSTVHLLESALHLLLGFCGTFIVIRYVQEKRRSLPRPPGPKALPLIGNLLDMPSKDELEWEHWAAHKVQYGPMSSVTALGTTVVIINDSDIAAELLEKRSSIYSSRPSYTFCGDLVGLVIATTLTPYGDTLRLHRKWMQSFLGSPSSMKLIEDMIEVETRRLLLLTLETPHKLMDHLHAFGSAIILKLAYGYNIEREGADHLTYLADEVVTNIFSESMQPGRWLVDILPILKYVPEWLPGTSFKRKAREWKKTVYEFFDKPFEFVKHQMARGKSLPSFVEYILEKGVTNEDEDIILNHAAGTMYGAGAGTTAITMANFYFAMTLYPDVFKRAQEEIDRVIGKDRLPNFTDREDLPYVNALAKEILRWKVVLPTGIPHATTEQDVFRGYHIPKGAIIIPNAWQMAHDAEKYHEPFTFSPERFLGENGKPIEQDPRSIAFGFGRRICPGIEVAERTLFMGIAMSIAVLNISKKQDKFGKEIEPVYELQSGVIKHPKPFACSITPRSDKATGLIRAVLEEHPFENGDGDILKEL